MMSWVAFLTRCCEYTSCEYQCEYEYMDYEYTFKYEYTDYEYKYKYH